MHLKCVSFDALKTLSVKMAQSSSRCCRKKRTLSFLGRLPADCLRSDFSSNATRTTKRSDCSYPHSECRCSCSSDPPSRHFSGPNGSRGVLAQSGASFVQPTLNQLVCKYYSIRMLFADKSKMALGASRCSSPTHFSVDSVS